MRRVCSVKGSRNGTKAWLSSIQDDVLRKRLHNALKEVGYYLADNRKQANDGILIFGDRLGEYKCLGRILRVKGSRPDSTGDFDWGATVELVDFLEGRSYGVNYVLKTCNIGISRVSRLISS